MDTENAGRQSCVKLHAVHRKGGPHTVSEVRGFLKFLPFAIAASAAEIRQPLPRKVCIPAVEKVDSRGEFNPKAKNTNNIGGLGLEHGRTATAAARLALNIWRREEPVSSSSEGGFVLEARTTTPALRVARFCRNAAPLRRVKVTDDRTSAADWRWG